MRLVLGLGQVAGVVLEGDVEADVEADVLLWLLKVCLYNLCCLEVTWQEI